MGQEEVILNRGHFLQAAVKSLMDQIEPPELLTIVAVGRDEFARVARSRWVGHGFTQDDFHTAFRMLEARARQVAPSYTGVQDAG